LFETAVGRGGYFPLPYRFTVPDIARIVVA
jgi:predicted DNA-binding protein YlxM (UPF0122 family)